MPNRPLMCNKFIFARVFILTTLIGVGMRAYPNDNFESLASKNKEIGNNAFTSQTYNPGYIKHIVIFKYRNGVTPEQKKEVIQRFLDLRKSQRPGEKSPYIISIATGAQSSGENAGLGFEQVFIVTFRSEGDRNYYVGTPVVHDPAYYDSQHAEFKKFVEPLLAKNNGVLVFDFTDVIHKSDSTPTE